MASLRSVLAYLRTIWFFQPLGVSVAAILMLLRTVLEGAGLLLIIPLLALSGVVAPSEQSGALAELAKTGLAKFGVAPSFSAVLVLFLVLLLLRSGVGFAQSLTAAKLQTGFLHHLRTRLHRSILQAHWTFLALQDTGRLSHALSVQCEQSAYGVNSLARLLSALAGALVSGAIAIAIEPGLSLLIIVLAACVAVPVLLLDVRLFRLSGRASKALEEMFTGVGNQLTDLKHLKVSAVGGRAENDFALLADTYRGIGMQRARLGAVTGFAHEAAGAFVLAGLVYAAVKHGSVIEAGPVAVAIIFARLFPAAKAVQQAARELVSILPAWQRLSQLHGDTIDAREPGSEIKVKSLPFTQAIGLKNVSYSYPGSSSPVLKDVCLTIRCGTATAITGLSGAGKTTLLDIVGGLLTPDIGEIYVDEKVITDTNRLSWRSGIAYVVQDAQLANQSVRRNVTQVEQGANDDEHVWAALTAAGAQTIVEELPGQLDETLGDRGQRLSRGQRQRIALARAIYQRPKLLVLDEATSALNPADEAGVIEALKSLLPATTLIIVSHRISSIDWVDQRLQLKDGEIVRVLG